MSHAPDLTAEEKERLVQKAMDDGPWKSLGTQQERQAEQQWRIKWRQRQMDNFQKAFNDMQEQTYETAKQKGWWDVDDINEEAVGIAYRHVLLSSELEEARTGKTLIPPGWGRGDATEREQYIAQKVALVHSELSEGLVDLEKPSAKLPGFTAMEEEMADAIIRMMDMSEHFDWDLAGAILAKMKYNQGRPKMHGGKKF